VIVAVRGGSVSRLQPSNRRTLSMACGIAITTEGKLSAFDLRCEGVLFGRVDPSDR